MLVIANIQCGSHPCVYQMNVSEHRLPRFQFGIEDRCLYPDVWALLRFEGLLG